MCEKQGATHPPELSFSAWLSVSSEGQDMLSYTKVSMTEGQSPGHTPPPGAPDGHELAQT